MAWMPVWPMMITNIFQDWAVDPPTKPTRAQITAVRQGVIPVVEVREGGRPHTAPVDSCCSHMFTHQFCARCLLHILQVLLSFLQLDDPEERLLGTIMALGQLGPLENFQCRPGQILTESFAKNRMQKTHFVQTSWPE